uniref:Uncharacterized protein n=1 Tax=Anas platyrhynchos TaxID=8839 RepID=A0A8B9THN0_ANAPL
MRPCLLLALALLGTASARHLGECPRGAAGTPEGAVGTPAVTPDAVPSRRAPAPSATSSCGAARTSTPRRWAGLGGRAGGPAAARPRPRRGPVTGAVPPQRVCSRCYRGRLASIHSYRTNVLLQCRARARVNNGRVWIGAITRPVVRGRGHLSALGSPLWGARGGWGAAGYGRWRSTRCRVRLPFICEY